MKFQIIVKQVFNVSVSSDFMACEINVYYIASDS